MKIHRHTHHYGILLLFLMLGMGAFVLAQGNIHLQFQLGVMVALGYAGWGILHHLQDGDVNRKIVVEYGLFALLVIIMLWALLLP